MSNASSQSWFSRTRARWSAGPGLPSLIFGVILPIIAIIVELTTHLCAAAMFDPLPTVFHVAIVASVPLINFLTWRHFNEQVRWPKLAEFASGTGIGVAAFYSILFLPILPVAVLGVLYFGIGVLPWTPVFACAVAILLQVRIRRASPTRPKLILWSGIVFGVLALVAADLPTTVTRYGLRVASSESPSEQARGVKFLRILGSEEVLLRACYVRTGRASDFMSALLDMDSVSTDTARKVYYRVTGVPFNARALPRDVHQRRRGWVGGDPDLDQGADSVGGRLKDLSLVISRIDGSIDADAALGYLEWTLVLRNGANVMREGRAQIALPKGAVVSRLTLWIDGEEREAAFAARGDVKAAYQRVVSRRRDPVLVTTAGHDRVEVRMFPVPANGDMKIRIGMTVPISLATLREGQLRLPYFHERNFDIQEGMNHSLWIEGKTQLSSRLSSAVANASSRVLRLDTTDDQLRSEEASIHVERAPLESVWARDSVSGEHLVKQSLKAVNLRAPRRIALVIDGSQSMAPLATSVASALAKLPPDREIYLQVASDQMGLDRPHRATPQAIAEAVRSMRFVGGHDNTQALALALDALADEEDSAVVWIHGPQPVALQTTDAIEHRITRGGALAHWYDVQIASGPNVVAADLERLQRVEEMSLNDLSALLDGWTSKRSAMSVSRERVAIEGTPTLLESEQTSTHLARLWANDEIGRLIEAKPSRRDAAIQLAAQYQLVTPVSGAVVLETQQQYDEAGLTPVPPGTVPTIPEPEEWALMAIAIAVLFLLYRRRTTLAIGTA